ncbi:hypothetical protein LIER_32709 [Lithospermum erythrorhizon]|uniref:Glycine-rich protein n=1 Tax=Lithospermum erythrorhizon TaxID=34254 RepID=A0AAV3RUL4_LITER
MEDSVSKGKTLNKEQEETLRTKQSVLGAIEELKKIKEPLSLAISEELQAKKSNLDDTQMKKLDKDENDGKNLDFGDAQMREIEKDLGDAKKLNLDDTQMKKMEKIDGDVEKLNLDDTQMREIEKYEGDGEKLNFDGAHMSEMGQDEGVSEKGGNGVLFDEVVVEDLLKLLYFGSMFDVSVKSQNDFVATMYRKIHERGCCLTYDYVTDDDASGDLLGEKDLDLISMLGELVISRPVDSSLSHKDALQRCIEHAKLWIANSDQPLAPESNITYAESMSKYALIPVGFVKMTNLHVILGVSVFYLLLSDVFFGFWADNDAALRGKLNKIMASDYFTTTPELKASVEMVAAAENYQSFHVPVNGPVAGNVSVEVEEPTVQHDHKEQGFENLHEHQVYVDQSSFEDQVHQDASLVENSTEFSVENNSDGPHTDEQSQAYVESKEQQNGTQRYNNYRSGRGGGGRRRNSNGYGGRGSGRGNGRGGYENGYGQAGNYNSRNNYNYRGRGGRGGTGGYYNQGSTQDGQ